MLSGEQNSTSSKIKSFLHKAGNYLLGYLIFGVCMAGLFFLLWRIRSDVIIVTYQMGYNKVQVNGLTNYTVVISGLLMLVGVGFAEDRLRKAIEENRMWKPLLLTAVITVAAWLLWLGIYYLAVWLVF